MTPITITLELLATIKNAQLVHARDMINASLEHGYSDDGYDYLRAALDLARNLVDMDYGQDVISFAALLNDEHGAGVSLQDYASDGICEAIYALKPPALNTDD